MKRNPRLLLLLRAAHCALLLAVPVAAQQPQEAAGNQREMLEQQFRARLGQIVRNRLGLTDAQATQLAEVDRRYQADRRRIMQQEAQARRALRQQMAPGANPQQQEVAALLDRMIALQRESVELTAREQRDLARFLTPVQRARYLALQNDLRRRIQQMQQGQGPARRRGGGRGPGIR